MSLIDPERLAAVRTMLAEGTKAPKDPLTDMSPAELRRLRAEIDRLLPEENLADMDMPRELMRQFQAVKDLQDAVIEDEKVPPNQRAQVAGQVASTLQQLVKMQTDFYTSERFRNIENLMIKFMKSLPLEKANEFLDEYEKIGGGE